MNDLAKSTRAELLRLRCWPALWVLVGVWLAMNLTFGYIFNYIAYRTGDSSNVNEGIPPEALLADLLPSALPEVLAQGMPMFGGAIMMILGAVAVGSGYGWGTWKTVLTQGPGRVAAFGGTLAALAVTVVGVVLVTLAADVATSSVLAAIESQPIEMPPVAVLAEAVGAALLVMGMWTVAGVVVGVLAKGPALAVGLGLVWSLVAENLLRGVSGLIDGLSVVTDYLPGTAAGSLVGALSAGGGSTDGTPGVLTILDGGTAAWVLTAYVAVFALVGLLLVRARDLT